FVACAAVAWLLPRFAPIAYAAAGALLILVYFPLIHLVDVMMVLGMAAVFGVLEAMDIAPLLPVVGPIPSGRPLALGVLGAAFLAALVTAAMVPAFSAERPLALNFAAHYDMDAREAELYASTPPGALPEAVASQLTVAEATT